MNRLLLIPLAASLLAAIASAGAQTSDTIPPVQPPPAMDDATPPPSTVQSQRKVDPKPKTIPLANSDAEAAAAAADARQRAATPVPVLPPEPKKAFDSPGLPPDVQRAAEATELPVITVRQCTVASARVAWFLTTGELPDGGRFKSRCGNRDCVRPNHLEWRQNSLAHRFRAERFSEYVPAVDLQIGCVEPVRG